MDHEELVGRKEELALLRSALESRRPELVVVYGRRRIGKTFLIRHAFRDRISFEFTGMHRANLKDQLKNFHLALSAKRKRTPMPADWLEAFDMLADHLDRLRTKRKKVLFIDEFPWLDGRRSRFLPAFSNFWNSYASKRKDLVVVICGSAASYMINAIINDRGGLHNRITRRIHLQPFGLHDTEQLLRRNKVRLTRYDILQLYMAMGGAPHYLQMVEPGESVSAAIDRLCFSRNGFLRGEFANVFASLFERADNHEAIVRALAGVRKGLTRNEILKRSGVRSGGTLTKTLMELEHSGFIDHYAPYRGVKDPLYRLTDEYALFYLKYVEGTRPSRSGIWMKLARQSSFITWAGFCFETICMKHVDRIKEGLGISGIHAVEGSWIGRSEWQGAQVDLLIDRDDNVITLCETKFTSGPFRIDKRYAEELARKVRTFITETGTRKSVFLTFITTYGLETNAHTTQHVQAALDMSVLFDGS